MDVSLYTDGEQATAETLNRPIKDLAAMTQARTWADVKKERENIRAMFPVSGQINTKGSELELVEAGGTAGDTLFRTNVYTSTTEGNNNNCLFLSAMDEGDTCCIGRYGDKSFNIHGQIFKEAFKNMLNPYYTKHVSRGGGSYNGYISFPKPSISATEPLIRQDLVGIEMWDEKISDRDVVFYGGCVQHASGSHTIQAADIPESYSAFYLGEELEPDSSTGTSGGMKCYKWSAQSDASKENFINDPKHGIFIRKGELYQTRYRWRVIKDYKFKDTKRMSFGAPTDSTGKLFNNSHYTQSADNIDVPDDYVLTVHGKYDAPAVTVYAGKNSKYTHAQTKNDSGLYVALNFNDESYASFMPIMAVQRRNYGAFHPTFNPYGTSNFTRKEGWLAANPQSLNECFDRIGYTTQFNNHLEIAGNSRSFIEGITGTSEGFTSNYALYHITRSTFSFSGSHSEYLSGAQGTITWSLPEAKILRKLFILNSDDWFPNKRAWMPDDFKIYGSTTGEFTGEETELLHVINGNDYIYKSDKQLQSKGYPFTYDLNVVNENAYAFYRFEHLSDVQFGIDRIEMFEDTNAVTNFMLNGIQGLTLIDDTNTKEYIPNISSQGRMVTRNFSLYNSFYSDSNGIPLNTSFKIYVNGVDTGKTVKFTDYTIEKCPSGSYMNYDRFQLGISKADYIQYQDVQDLRYILSSNTSNKE